MESRGSRTDAVGGNAGADHPATEVAIPTSDGRVEALEGIWWALAVDTHRTVDKMTREGWPADDAVSAYGDWLLANVRDAIEFGADWWRQAA